MPRQTKNTPQEVWTETEVSRLNYLASALLTTPKRDRAFLIKTINEETPPSRHFKAAVEALMDALAAVPFEARKDKVSASLKEAATHLLKNPDDPAWHAGRALAAVLEEWLFQFRESAPRR